MRQESTYKSENHHKHNKHENSSSYNANIMPTVPTANISKSKMHNEDLANSSLMAVHFELMDSNTCSFQIYTIHS